MERITYGDSAKMQAVTKVNARRGLETSNVDADPPVGRGRPARQGKTAIKAPCWSTGVESDSMHRRNIQKAREADVFDGGEKPQRTAREGQVRSRRWRRGS